MPDDSLGQAPTQYPVSTLPGPVSDLLSPGTVLFGEYEIQGRLGSGGMGTVYRAWHRSLGEQRAIKLMRPEIAGDRKALDLFLREARALLQVQHDAVVRCHDLLSGEDGRYFLVTELVEGRSLREILAERTLDLREVRALRERLADGLAAAHARGVVHRDLSPGNVILPDDRPERAKLIDFGVAKLISTDTTTLAFKGKLAYASPEQLGLFGGWVDGRSDLYSLGLVLAEAASGEPPTQADSFVALVETRAQQVPLSPRLPAALRSELRSLLEPDPAQRAQTAAGSPRRAHRRAVDHRGHRVALAVVGVAALVALWLWWSRDLPGPASPPLAATSIPASTALEPAGGSVVEAPLPEPKPAVVTVLPSARAEPDAGPGRRARGTAGEDSVPSRQARDEATEPVETKSAEIAPPRPPSAADSYQWGRDGATKGGSKWYEDWTQ